MAQLIDNNDIKCINWTIEIRNKINLETILNQEFNQKKFPNKKNM